MSSRINPYFAFNGNAREAAHFYEQIFGGELSIMTFADAGQMQVPDTSKVMHSSLFINEGMQLMLSDAMDHTPYTSDSPYSISLSGDDDAELTRQWEGLIDGGVVVEPLVQAPWGAKFGMCRDRYGAKWMINIVANPQ